MSEFTQLNTQIPHPDKPITPLQSLNLIDDFLFDVATMDLESCKIILELSLGVRIHKISWKESQKVVHNFPGKRGIRMDFSVEDEKGKFYDVEMQKRNEGNIPKRTRYYQALIDAPLLESGERRFDNLNPTYIIVICSFDLYGFGKYRYTFENRCTELPELLIGDECKKIILNTRGKNNDEVDQSLIDFLHYVERSTDDSISDSCDERLRYLHKKVRDIKSNEQMEVTYMKMEERDRLIREDGKAEGISLGRSEGIAIGISQGVSQGISQGISQGEERINRLNLYLINEKRYEDLQKAAQDKEYRRLLLEEFGI